MRVHIDYHVEVDGHFYSVPYQLVKHQLEVRLTYAIHKPHLPNSGLTVYRGISGEQFHGSSAS